MLLNCFQINKFERKLPSIHLTSLYHVLSGKNLSSYEELAEKDQNYQIATSEFDQKLKILQIGSRSDSSTYVKAKLSASKDSGCFLRCWKVTEDINETNFCPRIERFSIDDSIHGILIQLLLSIWSRNVITIAVLARKNVDGSIDTTSVNYQRRWWTLLYSAQTV